MSDVDTKEPCAQWGSQKALAVLRHVDVRHEADGSTCGAALERPREWCTDGVALEG